MFARPIQTVSAMPTNIVMWGAPASGKSTYLLSLVFWQEHREGNDKDRRLCVLPADSPTAQWVVRMATAYAERQRVTKTSSIQQLNFRLYDLPPRKPGFSFRKPTPSQHVADLTFWDAPGEFFEGAIPDDLLPKVVSATGLMLLINPASNARHGYWDFFHKAITSLQRGMLGAQARGESVPGLNLQNRRIGFPVAICLSHMDLAEHPERDAQSQLSAILGDEEPLLNEWLDKRRVFTFSSTGPSGANGAQGNDPLPRHILYPIEWLLGRHEAAQ